MKPTKTEKPYAVMWCGTNGWHTQRFATMDQAKRCAERHGVAVSVYRLTRRNNEADPSLGGRLQIDPAA